MSILLVSPLIFQSPQHGSLPDLAPRHAPAPGCRGFSGPIPPPLVMSDNCPAGRWCCRWSQLYYECGRLSRGRVLSRKIRVW